MPTQATVERLIREGLDRHNAIHAVGSVLVNYMHELPGAGEAAPNANQRFYEELKKLTAAEWLKGYR